MPASRPTISILLPVYNDAHYIVRAVTSMQRQTFGDWELLLLDDGSTDSSPDLIDSLARPAPRIKPVHLPHRGIAGSLNAGIQRTVGRYVARMDADDISHVQRLALQLQDYLEKEGLRVMGYVDVNPRRIGTVWNGKPLVGFEDLPSRYPGCVFLAAVGSWGVRDVIRRQLQSLGHRESDDFLCVAWLASNQLSVFSCQRPALPPS